MALINQDILKGKWKEIKGEIQRTWGNITGDEIDKTQGDLTSISGLIQQKYGAKKEEISDRLNEIVAKFDISKDRGHEEPSVKVSDMSKEAKDALRRH